MGGQRLDIKHPAPPRDGHPGGGGDGWVWLLTAKNIFEGEILKGVLESAGVPVMESSFDTSMIAWAYPGGNPNVPVKLFVPAALLETARLELLESSISFSDADPADAPRPNVHPHRHVRPLWIAVAVLTSLTLAILVAVELFGLAPCESRMLCPDQQPQRSPACGPVTKTSSACAPNR